MTIFAAVMSCASFGPPSPYLEGILAALVLWMVLILAWLTRLVLSVAFRDSRSTLWRRPLAWLVTPALFLITLGLVWLGAPLQLGARLAQPEAAAYANSLSSAKPGRIGPYPVDQAERLPHGGAQFRVNFDSTTFHHGLAYSPNAAPPMEEGDGNWYDHLTGPWYAWEEVP